MLAQFLQQQDSILSERSSTLLELTPRATVNACHVNHAFGLRPDLLEPVALLLRAGYVRARSRA
jgi:hypothetical protein